MRELYMSELEFRRLINPPLKVKGLSELKHPERLLSNDTKFYKFNEGYVRLPIDTFSPIKCNVLLTNKEHDGIWLLDNDGEVIIPGKIIDEEQLYEIEHNEPITTIYETILKLLVDANGKLDIGSMFNDFSISYKIPHILNAYNLDYISNDFPIYYNFYMGDFQNEINLFIIMEVDQPGSEIVPLSNYECYNLIWYSRRDHQFNIKTKRDRRLLFGQMYSDDVRVRPDGIYLLDKIFNTENIFGKLNIY